MNLRQFCMKFGHIHNISPAVIVNKYLDFKLKVSPRDDDGTEPEITDIYIDEQNETITIEVN